MTRAARIVAAARATIGARFRPHGRDPALGLDCVGVAVWALAAGGWHGRVPAGYALAAGAAAVAPEMLDGLVACDGAAAGDLLLCRAGGGLHLAIRTEAGVVHADAGLRRVVERPGAPPWPVLAAYRLEGE
ncbi:MAG: peptidoglycan endopeptidase [Sphingomonadales bacterium]|nr:peptidoglycan endopeptidase [Sphingomonadales bacterium]